MLDFLKKHCLYYFWFNYFPIELKEKMKDVLYKIIESYEYLSKYIIRLKLLKQVPLLILTMEKSSSTSLHYSLLDANVRNVFRFHYINPNRKRDCLNHLIFMLSRYPKRDHYKFFLSSMWFYKNIKKGMKVKIITLIRNPFDRSMSKLFHDYPFFNRKDLSHFSINQLYDFFFKSEIFLDTLNWFDNQLKESLNIDVFDFPFPRDKSYCIISQDNIQLLLLKVEQENEIKEKIISEFLNLSTKFKITNYNINKNEKNIYSKFKKNVIYPPKIENLIRNSNYYRHFY